MVDLTKREYFTAVALQALLSNPKLVAYVIQQNDNWIVESAVAWAEDTIKELERE